MEIQLAITVLILLCLVFLGTVDVAFGLLSDVGLRRLISDSEDQPGLATSFLSEILDDRPRFRFTLSVTIQFLVVANSVLITSICLQYFAETHFTLIAFALGVILAALCRQVIPRLISWRNPEQVLLKHLPIFHPLYRILSLLAAPWHRSFEWVRRKENQIEADVDREEETDADNLQALLDVAEEEGILQEDEGELIQSIVELSDTTVDEVMTPRTEIVALPITATIREARDLIIESKYSRLPVFRDQIDNVEGTIYVRDLLQYWPEGREDENIESLLRPAYFVPETKPVADLLNDMQKAHVHIALVIDEYGGVAGLVSVEDILEEIVGEIEDEDTEKDEIIEIVESTDGYYELPGSTEIEKIEHLLGLDIEDGDFTTIAGLVIGESGYVPRPGMRLSVHGLDVEVIEADERKINRLRLRRAPGEEEKTE
jgi:putative hemolysin